MVLFGVSINMISMIALLMAIGILMDDAIVISESIEHEYAKGKTPGQASIDGTKKVFRGVFSSYLTSAFLFGSLLMMKGDIGQILGVLLVVLLSVLTVSLIEAMLVLPHHLKHSLEHAHEKGRPAWRQRIDDGFLRMRDAAGRAADTAIRYRYL
ncbi:efflux RND transporter permease subunit, partial [Thiolapillus sp.]